MEFTPDEMELSKVTVGRCGGIPKVIATIGQLFTKDNAARRHWSVLATDLLKEINDDFMHKLETDQEFHSLRDLFSWMRSYFDGCSDSLKPCIFYLSIFPPEQKLRQRHLLRRWIAEGYSKEMRTKTAEEVAEEYFTDIINMSMVQQLKTRAPYTGKITDSCQVHDLIREIGVSKSMEENLVFTLEEGCSSNSQTRLRHLAISSNWKGDKNEFQSIVDMSRLRSITCFGVWKSFFFIAR